MPRREKTDFEPCEQKGADQTAHLPSLISVFVIRYLERMIGKLATCKNSIQ